VRGEPPVLGLDPWQAWIANGGEVVQDAMAVALDLAQEPRFLVIVHPIGFDEGVILEVRG